jgi:hypothetical protein
VKELGRSHPTKNLLCEEKEREEQSIRIQKRTTRSYLFPANASISSKKMIEGAAARALRKSD